MIGNALRFPRSLIDLSTLKNCNLVRTSLFAILAVAALGTMPKVASAQDWPQRPIMLIVPYSPGGTADFQARVMAEQLSKKLGQSMVVENKGGAAGIIATEYVIHSTPDGYTLLFGTSAQTTSVPMMQKVSYKLSDLIPISASGNGPMILAVNAKLPVHSLKEFVAYVKASPGKYTYASGGSGSVTNLVAALFAKRAGLRAIHVPFRGAGLSVNALISGHVDFYFGNSADLLPHLKDNHIRILAVSSPQRMPQLPDIPAVDEVIPGFEMTAWQGFLAPAHTPQPIIDKLQKAIASVAKEPEVIKKLATAGVQATSTNQAQFMQIIHKEKSIYAAAIEAAGLMRK